MLIENHTYYANYKAEGIYFKLLLPVDLHHYVFSIAALHLVGTMMLGIQRDPSAKSLVISVLHCKLKDDMLHLHDKLQGINLNVIKGGSNVSYERGKICGLTRGAYPDLP